MLVDNCSILMEDGTQGEMLNLASEDDACISREREGGELDGKFGLSAEDTLVDQTGLPVIDGGLRDMNNESNTISGSGISGDGGGSDDDFGDFLDASAAPFPDDNNSAKEGASADATLAKANKEDCEQLSALKKLESPESAVDDDDTFADFASVSAHEIVPTGPSNLQQKALDGWSSSSDSIHRPNPSGTQFPVDCSSNLKGDDGVHSNLRQADVEAASQSLQTIAQNFRLQLNGSKQNQGDTLLVKASGNIQFDIPSTSSLNHSLLQVRPLPPGFLRGSAVPLKLAAQISTNEESFLESMGLLHAYRQAIAEDAKQTIKSCTVQSSSHDMFLSTGGSGSLQSIQDTPSSGATTAYDLDFLARISGNYGARSVINSDFSFGSVCEQIPTSAPTNSSGKQSPSMQAQDLFSGFDNFADLDTSPPSSVRLSDSMSHDLMTDCPSQGISGEKREGHECPIPSDAAVGADQQVNYRHLDSEASFKDSIGKTTCDETNGDLLKLTQETDQIDKTNCIKENGEMCAPSSESWIPCPVEYSDRPVIDVDDLFTSDWLSTFTTSSLPATVSVGASAIPESQIGKKSTESGTMAETDCSSVSTKSKSSSGSSRFDVHNMVITSDHNPLKDALAPNLKETDSFPPCTGANNRNGITNLVQSDIFLDLPLINQDAGNNSWNSFQGCKSKSQEDDWGVFQGV